MIEAIHGVRSMTGKKRYPLLKIVDEVKFKNLLLTGNDKDEVFEASGIISMDGYFYVVFDNRSQVVKNQRRLAIGRILLSGWKRQKKDI